MASTLREELASLRIERPDPFFSGAEGSRNPYGPRRFGGVRLLSWLLWLIPLGLVAAAGVYGYRQYDQMRSRPEVTRGLVQRMTSGEAQKLLSAKGYLKSRFQARIGAKMPGRVERIYVHEGMKVKKGDTLAILEHNESSALLASREAQLLKNRAELEESQAEQWVKEREERRLARLHVGGRVTDEDYDKGITEVRKAKAHVSRAGSEL